MNGTILIVEDEAVVALDLQAQLEAMGYSVVGTAATGLQALALIRSHRPQLILMDIRLKGEMDGISVAQTVAREMGTPVVFLTSYSDNQTVDRAAQTAPYGYLTKPFQTRELRAVLEVAFARAAMENQIKGPELWFCRALHCLPDGLVVTGIDTRVHFLNSAAEKITGWSNEEAKGREVNEILRFATQRMEEKTNWLKEKIECVLQGGELGRVELLRLLEHRNNQELPVDASFAPIVDDAGQITGAMVVLRESKFCAGSSNHK